MVYYPAIGKEIHRTFLPARVPRFGEFYTASIASISKHLSSLFRVQESRGGVALEAGIRPSFASQLVRIFSLTISSSLRFYVAG